MILKKIAELAEKLDREGYFEAADELTGLLETAAIETLLTKSAAQLEVRIPVEEKADSNEWLATFNVWQDGQLKIGNLEQVSSPIFQTEELRAAGNKEPGIQQMKQQLAAHVAGFRKRNPGYAGAKIVVENPLFR